MKNTNIRIVAIGLFLTVSVSHADSADLKPVAFVAQKQEPVTVDDATRQPTVVSAALGGGLSCPTGYALAAVNANPEAKTTVTVYRECNGVGAYYVHTWCSNSPVNYSTVQEAPTVTYTCKKIENHWVAVV